MCACAALLFVHALTLTDGETTWIMAAERESEGGEGEQRRLKEDGTGGGGGLVHRPGGGVCARLCAGAYAAQEKSSLQWVSACPFVLAFEFPNPAKILLPHIWKMYACLVYLCLSVVTVIM